jgi:hypothetical protein
VAERNDILSIDKDKNKYLIFFLLALLSFIISGLNYNEYLTYNVSIYNSTINPEYFKTSLVTSVSRSGLVEFFTLNVSYFLVAPLPYLLSSLIVKFIFFIIIFKITKYLLKDGHIAFFCAVLFVMAPTHGSHGATMNGIYGPPIFFRSSVSALMSLLAIYISFKHNIIFASIFFALSIFIHPLYGLTCFTFFALGYLFQIIASKELHLPSLLTAIFIIAVPIASMSGGVLVSEGSSSITTDIQTIIPEWYHFVFSIDPDDAGIFWTFEKFGPSILLFLTLSSFFSFKHKKEILDWLFIGSLTVFASIVFIELLHSSGIFFGKLSELFIIVQLRRGLWVLMLFALMVLLREIYNNSAIISNSKLYIILLILFISFYLMPLFLNYGVDGLIGDNEPAHMKALLQKSVKGIFFIISAVGVCSFIVFRQIQNRRWQPSVSQIISVTIAFFVFASVARGVHSNILVNELQALTKNGWFSMPDSREKIINVLYDNDRAENHIDNDMVNKVISINTKHDYILLPPELWDNKNAHLFSASLFLSLEDLASPMFGMRFYDPTKNKYSAVFGKNEVGNLISNDNLSKAELFKQFSSLYSKVSIKALHDLVKEFDVRFFVTEEKYSDLALVIKGEKYYCYDLFRSFNAESQ